jgi:N-acetylglucosaminyldiphosphoundecaprenol N-acetyl-beta-D-mannosaminyltransferase
MERVKLLGYEIDTFTFDGALDYALNLEKTDKVSQVVTINPEMFDCAKVDEDFSNILKTAEMVIPDGVGVKLGLKILGKNVERIAGIDFARKMLELSAKNSLSVAIIGAKPEIIELAKQKLLDEIEGLNIVFSQDGYFDDDEKVLNELKQVQPRLVLVALGSPKQEKFISKAKSILPFGLMVGVGGSFDVWSGNVERAPEFYQKLGIEWLYRTLKQPERFKRIFPTLPLFVLRVLKEKLGV